MYDIIIIGAGVSGAAAARELSRYKAKICVLERRDEIGEGSSKANSAIVHGGFDAKIGSLKAKLNLDGLKLLPQLAKDLSISYEMCGSFVVCLDENNIKDLEELYNRGIKNGVEGLEIIRDKVRIKEMEPNITDNVVAVLYSKNSGIICPFTLNVALAENAVVNSVEFKLKTDVQNIEQKADFWLVETNRGIFKAKCIVNAAGVYADKFHNMVSKHKINITPRRGQYLLFDRTEGKHVNHVIFTLPGKLGKGILVTRTAHGNLLVGPTAEDIADKEDTKTTLDGLEELFSKAELNVKNLNFSKVITTFSGLRAHEDGNDFIIKELEDAPGFVDCAGIESPGLTSTPAIGKMVANIVTNILTLEKKENFISTRQGIKLSNTLSKQERSELIKKNPTYGNIICRCEMVSEGDILEAIHRPVGACTLDGIKRRTRAGSGRCQAGFCGPKMIEILNRELGLPLSDVTKFGGNSKLVLASDDDNK